MDLADAVAKRPPLGKLAYKMRVTRVLKTRAAQQAASRVASGFKRQCQQVLKNKGAGIHG